MTPDIRDDDARQRALEERERLLDIFATSALAMLSPWHEEPRRAAALAYEIADAMLTERAKRRRSDAQLI